MKPTAPRTSERRRLRVGRPGAGRIVTRRWTLPAVAALALLATLAPPASAQTPATCTSSSPAVSGYRGAGIAGIVQDCNTLLGLKDELRGTAPLNWSANTAMASWDGTIRVEDMRVTGLGLYLRKLSGSIPPELGRLTSLEWLGLDDNELSGSIPPELGRLTNLTGLDLRDNDLSGSIPPELGRLTSLLRLDLRDNDLSGSIPPELGRLTSLLRLDLRDNDLSGSIPPELGQLTSLAVLDLRDNELSGSIPPELGRLTNLTGLYLRDNDLSGSIPPELGQLTSLAVLDLSVNGLSGSIPPELGQLTSLEWLSLYNSGLSGLIPHELGQLTSLEGLYLGHNDLSGSIPPELGQLTSLEWLSLGGNKLSGCIPSSLPSTSDTSINPQQGGVQLSECDVLCTSSSTAVSGYSGAGIVQDCNTLLGLKDELRGSTAPLNWSVYTDIASWEGIGVGDNRVTSLGLGSSGLSGSIPPELGRLTSLTELYLYDNQLSGSIPPELGRLTSLTWLYLSDSGLSGSIPPELGRLTSLTWLDLNGNDLSGSIPPELGRLTSLTGLDLSVNGLSGSIPPELGRLTSLEWLWLDDNELSGSIPPELGRLTNLTGLYLRDNDLSGSIPPELGQLTSLTVLLLRDNDLSGSMPPELGRLTHLEWLFLRGNELSGCIPSSLSGFTSDINPQQGGVQLSVCEEDNEAASHTLPLILSASHIDQRGQWGFVRIINRSDDSREVRIHAIDDAGERFGPVTLSLGARQARHFNSQDLEEGNPAKGLSGGVGDGSGHWRLELTTALDIEALAYIRTSDVLSSMHEVAAEEGEGTMRYRVPFFNQGSDDRRRSRLRLVNPGESDADIVLSARDDEGAPSESEVRLTLPAGEARVLTAQALEAGGSEFEGRFGDGAGKWRVWVTADRALRVMSLLDGPTGNLTNLSSAGSRGELHGDGMVSHTLPLILSASHIDQRGQWGFVRIINRSDASGEVRIHAIDDAGERFGPVTLSLGARQARHFNSQDLEEGNPAKGLSGGVGDGSGHWRLELTTALDIEALAYIRTSDVLSSMHEVAAEEGEGTMRYRVPFFNQGSDDRRRSRLRLVNPGESDADIVLRAWDDEGAPSESEVRLTLEAGEAREMSAQALEAGGSDFEGRFGDGAGKWDVFVTADRALRVMSLLDGPTGNLTNLSSAGVILKPARVVGEPVPDGRLRDDSGR